MIIASLTVILIALIFLCCGDKGARSVVSTAMNALLLLLTLFAVNHGAPPVPTVFGICVLSAALTLFYDNEHDRKARAAFLSVLIVLVVTIPLVLYFAHISDAAGFNAEQYEITDSNGYTRNIGLSMVSLQIAVLLIALLGTTIDTSIAVASSSYEILAAEPDMLRADFLRASFRVGKAVMNTSIHTIYYIYIAEFLTLLIQYVGDFSPAYIFNSKSLASALICVASSGIGCCLAVPVTIFVAARMFHKEGRKSTDRADGNA